MATDYTEKTSKFGQLAPGSISKDQNSVQAFALAEDFLVKLGKDVDNINKDMSDYRTDVYTSFEAKVGTLSNNSSASDIVTVLTEIVGKLKSLK